MKSITKFALIAVLAVCSLSAFGQVKPADVLKDIGTYRTQAYADAKAANKRPDQQAIEAGVKAKAVAAIQGIDPKAISAEDAFDWARIFSIAQEHKAVCDLTHKFLTTKPDPEKTYQTQMLMMASCNTLGEGKMLDETLRQVKPLTPEESIELTEASVYDFADTIAKSEGPNAAIRTLQAVSAKVAFRDPKTEATADLAAYKARHAAAVAGKSDDEIVKMLAEQYENRNDRFQLSFVEEETDLLLKEGKRKQAIAAVDKFIASLPAGTTFVREPKSLRIRLALPGSVPPAMVFDHEYGDFKSLADWKGKVVIVDAFAHWCGPCKASFPDMRKMYDDLHAKGLEIVGVTSYYGFYGAEQGVAKEAEFAKMDGFRTEHNMNWPIIFGEKSNFENLGVTGIPTSYIIGRNGKVSSIHVGYDAADFAALRAEVEKELAK